MGDVCTATKNVNTRTGIRATRRQRQYCLRATLKLSPVVLPRRQLKLLNEEAMREKAKELEMLEVNLGIRKDLHRLRKALITHEIDVAARELVVWRERGL